MDRRPGGPNVCPSFRAGGTILPFRFVIQSGGADQTVLEAGNAVTISANGGALIEGANVPIVGISQPGLRDWPGPIGTLFVKAPAANKGDVIQLFSLGDVAPLQVSGQVFPGDLLTCSGSGFSDGRGSPMPFVPGTFSGTAIGARAMQAGVSGSVIMAQIMSFFV